MDAEFCRKIVKKEPISRLNPKRILRGPVIGCSNFFGYALSVYIVMLWMASRILTFLGVKVSAIES